MQEGQKSRSVPSSIPGDGSFCSTETEHDRRTAPRQNYVFRRIECKNKGQKPQKFLYSSTGGVDISFVTRNRGAVVPRLEMIVQAWILQEEGPQNRKSARLSTSAERGYLRSATEHAR
jgi:hypothetical protein